MVQFSQKEAHHAAGLGFAGRLDSAEIMMQVENIYLEEGKATTVGDGACKFFPAYHRHSAGY